MNKFMEKYLGKKGQGMVEYALIIAFVVGIASYAFSGTGDKNLGDQIKKTFEGAASTLSNLRGGQAGSQAGGQG